MTENEVEKLKHKIKTLTTTIREADDFIDNLQHDVSNSKKKTTSLEGKLLKKESVISQLNSDIILLENEVSTLKNDIKNTKVDFVLKSEGEELSNHKKDLVFLRKKYQELQDEYCMCCNDKDDLKKIVSELKVINELLVRDAQKQRKQKDSFQTAYMSLDYELNYTELKNEFEKIKNERDCLLSQLRAIKGPNVVIHESSSEAENKKKSDDCYRCCCILT